MLVSPQVLVADEVLSLNGASKVNFNRPVDRGYVTNWEVQDRVWRRMFKELHVSTSYDCLQRQSRDLLPD